MSNALVLSSMRPYEVTQHPTATDRQVIEPQPGYWVERDTAERAEYEADREVARAMNEAAR